MVTITGNTYPVKDKLRAIGGRWNPAAQGWDVDESKADEARAIVDLAPAGSPRYQTRGRGRSGPRSVAYRFSSGATMYQNRQGRCIDAPCCGCCS
jgi:hypothetical protein